MKKAILACLVILMFAQPVAAWGLIAHVTISSTVDESFISGTIAPDLGHRLNIAKQTHGENVTMAKLLAETMLALAESEEEKAFAKGWLAHCLQDAVAHGSYGYPRCETYSIGYINWEAQQTNQTHGDVEFEVDGRVFYEKGYYNGAFRIPAELVHETLKEVYGEAPSVQEIRKAYQEIAVIYKGEIAYWQSRIGKLHYYELLQTGRHDNYDEYIDELGFNPYYEALNLTGGVELCLSL
jgi:hypothetical protein